jgi:hypothetical protein
LLGRLKVLSKSPSCVNTEPGLEQLLLLEDPILSGTAENESSLHEAVLATGRAVVMVEFSSRVSISDRNYKRSYGKNSRVDNTTLKSRIHCLCSYNYVQVGEDGHLF